jgi:hypothetical protein
MDIAAIQSGTPFRLDFNAELATVGLSNVATGALGAGFTGSFIFRWAPRGVGRWQPVQRVVVAWRGGWVLDRWCRQLGPAAPASLPASWSLAACHSRPLAGSMRRSQTIFTGGAGVQSRLNGAGGPRRCPGPRVARRAVCTRRQRTSPAPAAGGLRQACVSGTTHHPPRPPLHPPNARTCARRCRPTHPRPPPLAVIALSELALFATPFSVVQYLPRFFFGGLLVW